MKGIYSPKNAEWLSEVLASGKLVIERMDHILGHKCVKLRLDTAETTWSEWVWLDVQHDALPRRYRREYKSGSTPDFVVDELQQLPNEIWFPKLCRWQIGTSPHTENPYTETQLVVVTEAAVNIKLEVSKFKAPKPEIGTRVSDSRTGKGYVHGKPRPRRSAPSEDRQPLDVSPSDTPSSYIWIFVLAVVSLAVLTGGIRFQK